MLKGVSCVACLLTLAACSTPRRSFPPTAADLREMSAEKRAIQYVVVSHRGALGECYWNEAARTPGLTGEILVRWHIDPGGSITESSIRRSSLSNANVEGCILREVNSWSFPATGHAADVDYPFRFGAGSSPARTP